MEELVRILGDLSVTETRVPASHELYNHITYISREMSAEQFSKYLNDVNKRIFELIHSPSMNDKLAGIYAITTLIDFQTEENATKITRFANYLRMVLPSSDLQVIVSGARALGKLAQCGGTLTADFVDFEMRRALDWLQGDRNEHKRLSAVYIVMELAKNAPSLVYSYVGQIIDSIWCALRDPKQVVREAASGCLDTCLELIGLRESQFKIQWYKKIYDEALKGIKMNNVESIHGSLLAVKSILTGTGDNLAEKYNEICEITIKYKDYKDAVVRKTVLVIIPLLAEYDVQQFCSFYLTTFCSHILNMMKKEKERGNLFESFGLIAKQVQHSITEFIDQIFSFIKDTLTNKNKNKLVEDGVYVCIGCLAEALGQTMSRKIEEILDPLFLNGLSLPLFECLIKITKALPNFNSVIKMKLLDLISLLLKGTFFSPVGAPKSNQIVVEPTQDEETIILSMRILQTFNFEGLSLLEFICECVLFYLDYDNVLVRKETVLTCTELVARDEMYLEKSAMAIKSLNEILEKLLNVGITDPEPQVRRIVFESLDKRFDYYLSHAQNIKTLFLALNDEVFQIREIVVSTLGRMADLNPACVLPSLRKTLIQLLTQLEYSSVSRGKEESATLLAHIIAASTRLVKPYVEPILRVLLPKLDQNNTPGVVGSILFAVGELAHIGGNELRPYLKRLCPIIIQTLQDQSSPMKRMEALKALCRLTSSTAYVIEPYVDYPDLLTNLISILKMEQGSGIRKETTRLLGVMGALDPYRYKVTQMDKEESEECFKGLVEVGNEEVSVNLHPTHDDYYPTIVIKSLVRILKDSSLSMHHTGVVQAIMYIFKTMGMRCVTFLPQVMDPYLSIMKVCQAGLLEFYFQQLSILIVIVRNHIRKYLDKIIELINEHWNVNIQNSLLDLIESISVAMNGEFRDYLPKLLPLILGILENDSSEKKQLTFKALQTIIVFGVDLEEYIYLTIPPIIKLFEKNENLMQLRRVAIETIGKICLRINFFNYSSRFIHPILRILNVHELKPTCVEALIVIAKQLNKDFIVFIPMVQKSLIKNKIQSNALNETISKILNNEETRVNYVETREEVNQNQSVKKLPVNQMNLCKSFEATQRSTKEDWNEWIRRFSVELLKESPCHSLRSCASLSSIYYPLARELFNVAFISCWTEMFDQFQDELIRSLEIALSSPTIPPEILQIILNLAEFMEHEEMSLPIDVKLLGAYAAKCHAFAKALHYKELEFINKSSPNTIESLISINNQLQQPDAAIGILVYTQSKQNFELKESWYEKLHRWEEALIAYEKRSLEDPDNSEYTFGKMRCLHALGDWERLSEVSQEKWLQADEDVRKQIAPLAAGAAWGLKQWESLDDYLSVIREDTADGSFFRAISALNKNDFSLAQGLIEKTRDLLDTELTALIGESYNRAYNVLVRIQMIVELEEIISFKKYPEKQPIIKECWMKRLSGCQRNVEVWQRILKIRSLVMEPEENIEMWIKFANLCRKAGRFSICNKIFLDLFKNNFVFKNAEVDKVLALKESSLKGSSLKASKSLGSGLLNSIPLNLISFDQSPPLIIYSFLKYSWETRDKVETLKSLYDFTLNLAGDLEIRKNSESNSETFSINEHSKLLAKCYHKLGQYQKSLLSDDSHSSIIHAFLEATRFNPEWYKAWHSWALANFQVVSDMEKSGQGNKQTIVSFVVPAVQGFFKSISLSFENSLQDTLRLLTLMFKYGYHPEGFNSVRIDTWLQVIPQLIARIHAPTPQVRRLIHCVLNDVGKEHPQALVYSLTVASKSTSYSRKTSALAIIEKMKSHSLHLVEQVLLVSQELIRVAILWQEVWHEGLEEASRLYFSDHNIEGMLGVLEPLHLMMERGAETLREISFTQAYGRDLQEANDWCKKYKKSNNVNDLNMAWDLYYHVFKRITKQLSQMTSLDLQYISPKLLNAKDLELAVPGTYKSNSQIIRIQMFHPTLTVITSKQRPRKCSIKGTDGKIYQYLLKGHEDLRQDERVMQLFGLVNNILASDPETFKRHLSIQRYPAIPLSQNSGLLGWVPHCDTLHALIREYREGRKVLLNVEHRMMLQMAPDYDNLTLLQKIEVFQTALNNTNGQDLYNVLWLKSKNSEAWLERRTNYTRSLAVMSMVGYILGLGDRHPSNLMLDRISGKIIHIDFGDCFEVAMHRDKFPEKIPFRLTRMLSNAMEVSGIEGSFRITCENVMRVLRSNKDSLMAVLEAFVYDPLINWRILSNNEPKKDLVKKSSDLQNEDSFGEVLNSKAVAVITRVSNKLTGRDFKTSVTLDIHAQVDKLIQQATAVENLCQCYIGWCPFW
ncbi:phosphatidylinositol kinase Tor2 [Rozella allomycis CSF55]|uniref:Serine/threonine-protein kinase TOR n=1 Tax=Rozella allomycis (strain CSF55) TaxID=988480 RepID=A0A075AXJ6_ROZAC|nr:Phosphatidylinositol 3-kinase Tor-like protein [Rozella allomycis CSF55]RKP21108.1 phosphatidylinositol kinase Tor2 [Rozella allomycis CSF55]|eukprot:EPZ33264.1 Phosphatidylinositol 3-kinase Tor-like protein [Rozella allomycis CSF55]